MKSCGFSLLTSRERGGTNKLYQPAQEELATIDVAAIIVYKRHFEK